jgi:hypothetical protein
MSLSDTKIRSVKPTTKPVRVYDSGGLYLEVAPAGGRWWRLKYRHEGITSSSTLAHHSSQSTSARSFDTWTTAQGRYAKLSIATRSGCSIVPALARKRTSIPFQMSGTPWR